MSGTPPRLVARGLTKRFPGVLALDGVELEADAGEVVAVVGENGAGKSTLMNVLAGLHAPDRGSMELDGAPWRPTTPHAAADGGVALVHQELCLADNLTAAQNICLGREPTRGGLVDERASSERASSALARVGATFAPATPVARLGTGERQLVEIAKALALDARVLILDEPTSSLSARECARLFDLVRALRDEGICVLYISHRLGEVLELADRAVVLRDGRNAGVLPREGLDRDALVRAMVGRDVAAGSARSAFDAAGSGDRGLVVRGLRTDAYPEEAVDLDVRPGELVGLAGLVGAGRTELLETLFGLRARVGGSVRLDGAALDPRGPRAAARAGVALVPEDRKEQGLLLDATVRENVALATLAARTRGPLVDAAREREAVGAVVRRVDLRSAGIEQPVGTLSGGNQQKIVLARWLLASPRLFLLDEPTRGVDVGARAEIYRVLEELARDGTAVLFASSELEEVLLHADRIVVLCEGRVTGELARAEATEESVMRLATGGEAAA